jgi:hypothetical protein
MPGLHSPDPPSSFKVPKCPGCGTPMQFQSTSPDENYSNLRHTIFVCDCGWQSDQLIADKN